MDTWQYCLWFSVVNPMESVAFNTKSDLKVTNVCLGDAIRSARGVSKVSLMQGSVTIRVLLLEPFQFDQRKLDVSFKAGTRATVTNHGPNQVFVMGYYLGGSTDTSMAMQNDPTITTQIDQREAELRVPKKMELHDRIIGVGLKVSGTSVVGVRYEIKTTGGVVIDNNRKSNTRNRELLYIDLRKSDLGELSSVIREGIIGMAQGGTRKITLSPMELTINGMKYGETLIIEVKVVSADGACS